MPPAPIATPKSNVNIERMVPSTRIELFRAELRWGTVASPPACGEASLRGSAGDAFRREAVSKREGEAPAELSRRESASAGASPSRSAGYEIMPGWAG